MGLYAKEKGGEGFDPIDEGIHHAIAYSVYDLGHQYNEKFNKSEEKVIITWELPDERIEIEKEGEMKNLPRAISRKFTNSLHKKSHLRQVLTTWRGRDFTTAELEGFLLTKILGVHCQLQVIHNKTESGTYANITAILPYTGEDKAKKPENPIRSFSLDEDTKIPDGCPEWISNIIMESEEWKALWDPQNNKIPTGDPNEDPPWEGDQVGDQPF